MRDTYWLNPVHIGVGNSDVSFRAQLFAFIVFMLISQAPYKCNGLNWLKYLHLNLFALPKLRKPTFA